MRSIECRQFNITQNFHWALSQVSLRKSRVQINYSVAAEVKRFLALLESSAKRSLNAF